MQHFAICGPKCVILYIELWIILYIKVIKAEYACAQYQPASGPIDRSREAPHQDSGCKPGSDPPQSHPASLPSLGVTASVAGRRGFWPAKARCDTQSRPASSPGKAFFGTCRRVRSPSGKTFAGLAPRGGAVGLVEMSGGGERARKKRPNLAGPGNGRAAG